MSKSENDFPNYYDGSSNVEFSQEITEGPDVHLKEAPAQDEEWRRYISANPYGMHGHL
ncbi:MULTISPECIES: hypothetical protein [Paenibacillus]|uniref:Uncharacterized protein n=1 Tax=Paenibacillus validus TaxID=44253 RepID=A0A7X3CRZ8_9BACL|nr:MULTISPECIES: hypothetical protein [Paenibacillus]MUG70241.1 hypothetical protein [Paenibacillus validus]